MGSPDGILEIRGFSRKKLAICIGLISPAVMAQSNVTIYGVVDVSAQGFSLLPGKAGDYSSTSSRPAQGNTFNIQNNASLLGFRSEEHVRSDLKVLLAAETALTMTGGSGVQYGTGTLFGGLRDTYLGAAGVYGQIKLGYNSTPFRASLVSFEVMPGGASGSADITRIMGGMRFTPRALNGTNGSGDALAYSSAVRATSVVYSTPTWQGLKGAVAYTGSNNNGTNNLSNEGLCGGSSTSACTVTPQSAWGFNLEWSGHGVNTQVAFQQANYHLAPQPQFYINNMGDFTSFLVGAAYTGVPGLKLSSVFIRNNLQSNGFSTIANGPNVLSNNQLWVGAAYRFGANEPRMSVVWNSDTNGSSDNQYGARQWNLNWGHYLSKRTQVYGVVSYLSNSANQNYAFGFQPSHLQPTGGQNLLTYGSGMRTTF